MSPLQQFCHFGATTALVVIPLFLLYPLASSGYWGVLFFCLLFMLLMLVVASLLNRFASTKLIITLGLFGWIALAVFMYFTIGLGGPKVMHFRP